MNLDLFRRIYHRLRYYHLCRNVNGTEYKKQCLLLYLVAPFKQRKIKKHHTNQWQVLKLAEIIGEFQYNVDVINYNHKTVRLKQKYDLVIDLHPGLNPAYRFSLAEGALKIAYMTGSNPSFSNRVEQERIDALYARRGIRVKPYRFVEPIKKAELESCGAMFFIGNSYNLKTFSEFDIKQISYIKNGLYELPTTVTFHQKSPHNFLFLGGFGQILKGLDLLLEVFKTNKHLNLYVCSNFANEKDFCSVYHNELFQSSNIFPIGFVNTESIEFRQICDKCSYIVLPSASEGVSGSTVVGMSYGLIPIVSRICGFEDDEVYQLDDCEINTLSETLNRFANKPLAWIENEGARARRIVQERYNSDAYIDSVRLAMTKLLKDV